MGDVRGGGLAWAPANAEALAAVTSLAGDTFGVADQGWIAEGHLADLVLVRSDLEEDLSRSHDIVGIWKDGYLVERAGGSAGAGPQAEIAPAPAETLVANFEDGFEARFGEWDVTTDQMTGGSSSATGGRAGRRAGGHRRDRPGTRLPLGRREPSTATHPPASGSGSPPGR